MKHLWWLLGAASTALQAQSSPTCPTTNRACAVAATITEAAIRTRINLIADDSMRGRGTPSPELDQTARYIAAEFRRFGLHTTEQRYPLERRRLVPEQSTVVLNRPGGERISLDLGPSGGAAFLQGRVTPAPVTAPVLVLGGLIDPAQIPLDSLKGKAVLWLADFGPIGATQADAIGVVLLRGGAAMVLVAPTDSTPVVAARAGQAQDRLAFPGEGGLEFTVLMLSAPALARGSPALGAELDQIRHSPTTVVRTLSGTTATLTLVDSVISRPTAPNVIGIREGTDPKLRHEYVVFSAHMDHLGVATGVTGDSIYNGADDNGSGTVGVLELARALGNPGVSTKRSLLFLSVSGEEKGLWGSAYFTKHPPIPIGSIVADVNMDMIGRNWKDTVGVIGREHSDLGTILDSVAARHRDLRVFPVDDRWPTQGRFFRSDHYNFARAGVPIIFLSSGYSPDYHELSDSPDKIDAEKEARLVQLVFFFGLELGNRPAKPAWNPASRAKIVETGRP